MFMYGKAEEKEIKGKTPPRRQNDSVILDTVAKELHTLEETHKQNGLLNDDETIKLAGLMYCSEFEQVHKLVDDKMDDYLEPIIDTAGKNGAYYRMSFERIKQIWEEVWQNSSARNRPRKYLLDGESFRDKAWLRDRLIDWRDAGPLYGDGPENRTRPGHRHVAEDAKGMELLLRREIKELESLSYPPRDKRPGGDNGDGFLYCFTLEGEFLCRNKKYMFRCSTVPRDQLRIRLEKLEQIQREYGPLLQKSPIQIAGILRVPFNKTVHKFVKTMLRPFRDLKRSQKAKIKERETNEYGYTEWYHVSFNKIQEIWRWAQQITLNEARKHSVHLPLGDNERYRDERWFRNQPWLRDRFVKWREDADGLQNSKIEDPLSPMDSVHIDTHKASPILEENLRKHLEGLRDEIKNKPFSNLEKSKRGGHNGEGFLYCFTVGKGLICPRTACDFKCGKAQDNQLFNRLKKLEKSEKDVGSYEEDFKIRIVGIMRFTYIKYVDKYVKKMLKDSTNPGKKNTDGRTEWYRLTFNQILHVWREAQRVALTEARRHGVQLPHGDAWYRDETWFRDETWVRNDPLLCGTKDPCWVKERLVEWHGRADSLRNPDIQYHRSPTNVPDPLKTPDIADRPFQRCDTQDWSFHASVRTSADENENVSHESSKADIFGGEYYDDEEYDVDHDDEGLGFNQDNDKYEDENEESAAYTSDSFETDTGSYDSEDSNGGLGPYTSDSFESDTNSYDSEDSNEGLSPYTSDSSETGEGSYDSEDDNDETHQSYYEENDFDDST